MLGYLSLLCDQTGTAWYKCPLGALGTCHCWQCWQSDVYWIYHSESHVKKKKNNNLEILTFQSLKWCWNIYAGKWKHKGTKTIPSTLCTCTFPQSAHKCLPQCLWAGRVPNPSCDRNPQALHALLQVHNTLAHTGQTISASSTFTTMFPCEEPALKQKKEKEKD